MKTETLLRMLTLLVFFPLCLNGQNLTVSGKITDRITGNAISQLTVVDKNSGIGTISSFDGSFLLLLMPGEVALDFFSAEYELQSVSFDLKRDTFFQVNVSRLKADRFRRVKKESFRSTEQREMAHHPDGHLQFR